MLCEAAASSNASFVPYTALRREACLALFDANCPSFFAHNERDDYAAFLDRVGSKYVVRLEGKQVVAAFGLFEVGVKGRFHLNWIMVHPKRQGAGLGRAMMAAVLDHAVSSDAAVVDIAASHLSAPFFERFGAQEIGRMTDGWGAGMHRVDMELRLVGTTASPVDE